MNRSFVYAAVRTSYGKFDGALAGARPDDLASVVITGALANVPELCGSSLGVAMIGSRAIESGDADLVNAKGGAITIGHPR